MLENSNSCKAEWRKKYINAWREYGQPCIMVCYQEKILLQSRICGDKFYPQLVAKAQDDGDRLVYDPTRYVINADTFFFYLPVKML